MGKLAFLLVGSLALGPIACGGAPPTDCVDLAATGPARVLMVDMSFAPACFSVRASQAITLVNDDAADHTFTIRGTSVDLDVGADRTLEGGPFEGEVPPGTYDVFCRYHPGMTGTITVT